MSKTPEETDMGMSARYKASRELVNELVKNNPLEDRSPEDMAAINERCIGLQDGLRGAMMVAMHFGGDPIIAFNAALEALITALSTIEQTDQTREMIGYLLCLAGGVKGLEHGPLAIAQGELTVSAIFNKEKEITKAVRDSYGLGDGPIELGVNVIKEPKGNVIDASDLFRKAGESIH